MDNIKSVTHLCFECNSCVQICSKKAIDLKQDKNGFSYPQVDESRCVNCGMCIKTCPAINPEKCINNNIGVYAIQLKDSDVLSKSSSGGVFSLIAKYVIKEGGVVFGAAWDDNLQLRHIAIDRTEDLGNLRGSKYVHSDIGSTYKEAYKYLKEGRKVYFTGTPCQIAGLKLFLRQDYPELITSDLVCHGTPSQKIFNLFVGQMQKERNVRLIDYQFRDKQIFGWSCSSSSSSIDSTSGKKHYHYYDKNMEAYFQAFIKGHITREDCYSCPFACPQRVGDITLADYWDIAEQHPDFPNQFGGVSLVLVNSDKGESLLNLLSDQIIIVTSSMEKVLATSNHNLKAPTPRPEERNYSYRFAFEDFIAFRDKYAKMAKPEEYYRRAYIINRVKTLPVLHTLLKIIGKA